jgi:hypothetical protein
MAGVIITIEEEVVGDPPALLDLLCCEALLIGTFGVTLHLTQRGVTSCTVQPYSRRAGAMGPCAIRVPSNGAVLLRCIVP